MCFPEKSPAEINSLVRENFKRIGENFICPVKIAVMEESDLHKRVEVTGAEKVFAHIKPGNTSSVVLAIGHFGNFELFAHLGPQVPSHQFATTYRGIRNPAVDRLVAQLRASSGCLYFERRSEGSALRAAMRDKNLMLGLLADQHSGEHGVRIPFLGHDCNTSKAPAVFALRFNTPLHTAICYRTKLAHWRVEVGDEIPTHENGQPRSNLAIMLDVNRAFEAAVRRDPANWFWVHNRWKGSKIRGSQKPVENAESESDPGENENRVTERG
jgi:KDO2-lipid IV(A) lauroyltransferase